MDTTNNHQTTVARALFKKLGGEKNVVYLTHDHYYKDQSHKTLEERAKTNFDHPDSLETELLVEHLKSLRAGETACLPTYDFATHSRTPVTTFVHPKPIIIVEGILVLTNQDLCDQLDIKVFVVSARVCGFLCVLFDSSVQWTCIIVTNPKSVSLLLLSIRMPTVTLAWSVALLETLWNEAERWTR